MDPVDVVVVSAADLQLQLAKSFHHSGAAVRVKSCPRASALAALAASSNARLIVAELQDSVGASTVSMLVDVQRRENVPIIMSVALSHADMRRAVNAISAGLTASWAIRGVDHLPAAITRAIAERLHADAAALVLQTVWPAISSTCVREFLVVAAIGSSRPMSTLEAANILGRAPRTLETQLKDAGYPPPRRVLSWCRALRATWLFDRLYSTPKEVTNSLSFSSIPALYNLLHHYSLPRPAALRAQGGFDDALRRFAQALTPLESQR